MHKNNHNIPQMSVSDISTSLKKTLEDAYSYVRVKGEISGCKVAASGHIYLSIKDENASLSVICWKGSASKLTFAPEDGLEVVCTGRITTYAGQSKYQLVAEFIEPAGEGALMALLEKRKKQFAKEGLFDACHKKPLPFLPKIIGVVTSPTGAVIRDIIHRIEERFPVKIIVWPVLVQGEKAASQITNAINGFNSITDNQMKPDILIVARGGGSIEDLWCFNEENVVRAVFNSKIPTISAVGHETDTTLIDYVSDLRAPTPTAAAEKAVPVRVDLLAGLNNYQSRLNSSINTKYENSFSKLSSLSSAISRFKNLTQTKEQQLDILSAKFEANTKLILSNKLNQLSRVSNKLQNPASLVNIAQIKIDNLNDKFKRVAKNSLNSFEDRLVNNTKLLESLSYKKVLDRGFAVISSSTSVISSSEGALSGQNITIEFSDGKKKAKINGVKAKKKNLSKLENNQPSLF